jgi:hypothetical protein
MRYCIHDWSGPVLVGSRHDVTWECRRCDEVRAASGDKPLPGTMVAAAEDFSNALRNLGLEVLDALPAPLRRLRGS